MRDLREALTEHLEGTGVEVAMEPLSRGGHDRGAERHLVTVLAPEIDAATLAGVTGCIAARGGNIERIVRLSAYPVHTYELIVVGGGPRRRCGGDLAGEAVRREVDIAVQAAGLHRRAKHLIVMDADSTLLQGEVVDLLAERRGCGAEVAAVTAAAMAGEIDFAEALRQRVRLLAGLKRVRPRRGPRDRLLAPGARTLVRPSSGSATSSPW